jgi:SecD/SecF fusion protein
MEMKKQSVKLGLFFIAVTVIFSILGYFGPIVAGGITKGLDLDGGFEIVYEVSPLKAGTELPSMASVARSVSKRIDILGVSEPQITIEGNNRIRVQLAGVKDTTQARSIISTTANLTFRDANDNLLMGAEVLKEGGASLGFENGIPVVSLKIADTAKFAQITGDLATKTGDANLIVTWLDFNEGTDTYKAEAAKDAPKYISVAGVNGRIDGDAIIKGSFTQDEARELADLINSGSLPVKMSEIYANVVSAQYGANAFDQTLFAGILGTIGVIVFMIFAYRLPGAISSLVLLCFLFMNIAIYNAMGGVLTLPGIAALILGVGMTVDANIITFERIKDELLLGRGVQKAYQEGNSKAFMTIFDSQFTTFISAVIMYTFGTGAVKGFATMLMVTIFCTLTLQVFLTKYLLGLIVNSGWLDNRRPWLGVNNDHVPDLAKGEGRKYFGIFHKVNFVGVSRIFITGSLVVLISGVLAMGYHGVTSKSPLNLGIDFSSGTKITVVANESLTNDSVRATFEEFGIAPSKIQISGTDQNIANVTFKDAIGQEELKTLKADLLTRYGNEANDASVTPVIGRELVRNAFILSIIAWIAMMIYITLRFEWDYAFACIVALLHDVLIVLALFAIFRFEFNSELVAVILAIIGYSIDDSIVIFDRIRENVREFKKPHFTKSDYVNIVNEALQHTAMRSLLNTITTLIPIAFLLFMASQEIFIFNVAMFIGLIAGAYSSLFIAAQLWLYIRLNRKPRAVKVKKVKKSTEPTEMTFIGLND